MGNCMFRCGYTLYADTCIGRCIHNKFIHSFQKQFGTDAVHSKLTPFIFNDLLIMPIPVLVNNYAYMVADLSNNNYVLVDVGDATMISKIKEAPDAILTTHKHWDHSGGNRQMRRVFPKLKVYGGTLDHVPDSTDGVNDKDVLMFNRLKFTAMWTPGHTRGHIVWRLSGEEFGVADSIFSGDHLMLAGCGAAFEGSIKQMINSLELLNLLPPETLVWPGHEMGLENLELAAYIEPDNIDTILKLVWATSRRDLMLCTCPSRMGEEKRYNPFLRTRDPQLWKALGIHEKIKNAVPPLEQSDIGVLCFDWIVERGSELRRAKRALSERERDTSPAGNKTAVAIQTRVPNQEDGENAYYMVDLSTDHDIFPDSPTDSVPEVDHLKT
ncbi:hydrolase PNKD [Biomphalaria pfeifferi]|uniref:Hydrolase PNKD n=1 Tax=Biomphalaria pfeifferi TaxID=112525 RepID=A0AAD8BZZ0_BIOPF|nr:hydrolase PNKD [Biomphalaria pfeifferi]